MNEQDFRLVLECLINQGKTFKKNELAYLALTSKIELPFRDRLAFQIHKHFERQTQPMRCASREWKRFDLAILENGEPSCLIELKAMYAFDAFSEKGISHYAECINSDIKKMTRWRNTSTSKKTNHAAFNTSCNRGLPASRQRI